MKKQQLFWFFQCVFLVFGQEEEFCEADKCKDFSKKLEWHEFDWKTYIKKDLIETDIDFPTDRFGINLPKSIEIGVNRTIPDNRNPKCGEKDFEALARGKPFPKTTVIITFRDEPRSTLLRTIVSVFQRSPAEIIQEIILVDDNNDDISVGQELNNLKKVKVLRNEKREGLIRSRIKATKAAKGEVLVFLDSHCEVETGWLEPLLLRIMDNPKRLVCPVIENINYIDYQFEPVSSYLRGGFGWHLDFFWELLPVKDRARRLRDATVPVPTPAIAGGLFAINREWFIELGIYDDGLEIWGGENIEISLRIWMCGGEMEIVPCSKVGHIYKQRNVYSYPQGAKKTTQCNTKRVARTWLDQYEVLYNFTLKNSELKEECGGKPSKIIEIRKKLQCKSFEWYINNIYPELMVPSDGDFAFGQIHTKPTPQMGFTKCIDLVAMGSDDGLLGLNGCLLTYAPQLFRYTYEGQIAHDDFCITQVSTDPGSSVLNELCRPGDLNQVWDRIRPPKNNLGGYFFKNRQSKMCIDVSESHTSKGLTVKKCDPETADQRFLFDIQIVKA